MRLCAYEKQQTVKLGIVVDKSTRVSEFLSGNSINSFGVVSGRWTTLRYDSQ